MGPERPTDFIMVRTNKVRRVTIVGCGVMSVPIDIFLARGFVFSGTSTVVLIVRGCLTRATPRNADAVVALDRGRHSVVKRKKGRMGHHTYKLNPLFMIDTCFTRGSSVL
jgi:hypothetical protein